jgi:uncharacterized protein with von Willebrand factor type A (vWA) domain
MGKDKGKARKSLSFDKSIDRLADSYYSNPNPKTSPTADALFMRRLKRNISPQKRQSYVDAANAMKKQFESKRAQEIINDQRGGPKMKMKGFGN